MKELKLKIWDKYKEEMVKLQAMTFDVKSFGPFALKVPGGSWETADRFEVFQWTGLQDKDGMDVYESDLIKISSSIFTVSWNIYTAGFELVNTKDESKREARDVDMGHVVGNRYLNPELLL